MMQTNADRPITRVCGFCAQNVVTKILRGLLPVQSGPSRVSPERPEADRVSEGAGEVPRVGRDDLYVAN